jgi:tetratricopeptide (TPR) repeat protein
MIRTLSVLPLLCTLNLVAQNELSTTPIRGEVKGLGSAISTNLTVEAYDSSTHLRVGQALVSVTGNFDLNALPRGNYELRLVSPTGQVLQTQSVNLNAPMQAVDFEIPKEKESKPASGAVEFSQLEHPPDPRAVKIFQKAIKAVAKDDHKQAIELLQKTIDADPNFAEAHLNLATQYAVTGDAARSLEESETAARLAPANWLARLNLAVALFRVRRLPDAELEARAATRLDPANTKAAFLTGVILAGEGKITPETLFYLKKAYADFPQARELGARLEKQLAH